jgi:DUF971 family protein
MAATLSPLEVRNHHAGRWLEITWSDGVVSVLPHRLLREACRCAQCVAAQRSGSPVAACPGIRLDQVEPYGANVLRLVFDDGHSRGLYPFAMLRELPAGRGGPAAVQQENVLANPSSSSGLR